jgi:SNF2 family DNA or RNA helicase
MPAQNTLRIEITIYGTTSIAKLLGPLLYQNKVNISVPIIPLPPGMTYFNPISRFGHIPIDDKYKQLVGLPQSSNNSDNANQNMKNQIDKVFDSLKPIDELPELEPNKLINTPLYKYQKQALYFMVQREKDATEDYFKNDSIWKLKENKSNGRPEYVNSITKTISKKMPKKVQGGIIADDMGLGKTFQMLCLIMNYYNEVKSKDNDSDDTLDFDLSEDYLKEEDSDIDFISIKNGEGESKIEKSYISTKATLIICPLSVISNWDEQINTHIKEGILKVYIHHGSRRFQDPSKIASYDIVISTYNVLALEYNKEKNNENYFAPLHKIEWFRIILDEAHYIKEAQTLQSRAACELEGKRRWCLSGTPMQNKIDDLYGLIKFLGFEPLNKKSTWINYISKPMKSYDNVGISSLQALMKSIAIRRTKESTFNGKKLIELPPKSNEYVKLQLSPEAREIYNRVLEQGKMIFIGLVNQGTWAKHYVHILEIILRLRQIATHLSLCTNKDLTSLNNLTMSMIIKDEENVTTESKAMEIYNILKDSAENQCLLCGYDVDNIDKRGYISSCGHLYCADCLKSRSVFRCVECQKDINKNKVVVIPKTESNSTEFFFNEVETDCVNVKVNRLINDLLRDKKMKDKSIVFSQWTKVFDLLDCHLKKANIEYVRLDGQMSRIKRNESIQKFKNDPNISVMLISLKAGGLGLTLTVASRVYLFEPHFNPAAENQAIDRVHRLGQNKPVFVYHYIMENTIEENIVDLQNKKRALFNLTFNRNKKLTKEEIESRRLADLRFLFK